MLLRIPDDCVLDILSYLEFSDLDELSCVSRRMRDLVEYQLSRTEKKQARQLRIVENEIGHAFLLFHAARDLNFVYIIENLESSFTKYIETGALILFQKFLPHHKMTQTTLYQQIPLRLIERLEQLLYRYSFAGLYLKNVRIT
ncbi:hypothetical protein PENTCL1PPCAC_12712, partial [Pristionchus entomophagus]